MTLLVSSHKKHWALLLSLWIWLAVLRGGLVKMPVDPPVTETSPTPTVPTTTATMEPAFAYNLDEQTDGDSPADVLATRLHSVLRIMGMDVGDEPGPSSPAWDDDEMDAEFAKGDIDGEAAAANMSAPQGKMAAGVKGQLQAYAQKQMAAMGMNPSEIGSLITLWNKESGWNPNAQNPTSTAYGIAQFLNGTWGGTGIGKTSDPYQQINAGLIYIKNRYGGAANALNFHLSNNWY